MAGSKLTNRTVSQVAQYSNWLQDVRAGLVALEDIGFFTFADMDFMDKNNLTLASFKNFTTDAIIQTGELVRLPASEAEEVNPYSNNADAVRLYYAKQLYQAPLADSVESITSQLLAVELEYNGTLVNQLIPTVDGDNVTIPYGIARLSNFTTPNSVQRYKLVGDEQVADRVEDYWYAEADEFEFEGAFQHDIYDEVVREPELTTYNDDNGGTFQRYAPIYKTESWDVNTTYFFMTLDTTAEAVIYNNEDEEGIDWGIGLAGNPPDVFIPADVTSGGQDGWSIEEAMDYTWTVTAPAIFRDDIVINAARFWGTDKINRFN